MKLYYAMRKDFDFKLIIYIMLYIYLDIWAIALANRLTLNYQVAGLSTRTNEKYVDSVIKSPTS